MDLRTRRALMDAMWKRYRKAGKKIKTKLSQSKFIRILDANTIYGILRRLNLAEAKKYSNEDLVKVANEAGANFTLSGSLMKAGDKIIINLTLQKPRTSEVISPLNVECQNEAEIIQKVDEVATKIKSDLNLTSEQIAGDIDKNIGEISTPNAEAWAYYVEARRYHYRGEYDKAIPLLQKVLSLDPEFIMAMRALGTANYNISNFPESERCAARTLELVQKHPERISERDRYIVEQNYSGSTVLPDRSSKRPRRSRRTTTGIVRSEATCFS